MKARRMQHALSVLTFAVLLVSPNRISSVRLHEHTADSGGLIFSSFLGGSDDADEAWDVATDASGDIYVVGDTYSSDFPATAGAYDTTYNGGADVFVARISADGTRLIWATYLGGSANYDHGRGVAVDGSGVYITGYTSSPDFPVTSGAYDTSFNGGHTDIFVAKLKLDGSAVLWSTYLGGGEPALPVTSEYPFGLAVDGAGSVYVAGSTETTDFPTTAGAHDDDLSGSQDAFVTKVKADGSALVYSTYLGGTSHEYAQAIAVDKSNQAYVTGRTYSTDFPTTTGAYDTSHNGGHDAYVAKLKADGSGLVYGTFIGGSDWEIGLDLLVDSAYRLYLAGSTESSDFPTSEGAYDRTHNGRWDAFVLRLATDGRSLNYSTLIGGIYEDRASGIGLDSLGNVHLVGDTISPDFPVTAGAYDPGHNGSWDAFVARVSNGGAELGYASYLGGHTWDEGHALSVDSDDGVVVVGRADSSTFPVTSGVFDTTFGPFRDGFVTKLAGPLPDIAVTDLEITQGIQDLQNSIPLVGHRATWARAYVKQISAEYPFDVGVIDATLRGYRDGQALAGSPLTPWSSPVGQGDGGDRLALGDSLVFHVPEAWRSGTVTFTVEVFPASYDPFDELDLGNNALTETLTFHPVDPPCLVMVPVHLHGDGGTDITYHTTDPGFKRVLRGLNRYHPIPSTISWWNSTTLYPAGHDAGSEYDLSNGFERTTLLQRVRWRNWWTDDPEDGCHYVGMVSPLADTTKGSGEVLGLARVGGRESWVKMEDSTPREAPYWYHAGAQTLAHELGHNKGLGHAYCNGDEDQTDAAYPWPYPDCQLANIDTAGYYGLTVYYATWGITQTAISNNPAALSPHHAYPVMGYKRPQWVSPWEYCKLLDTAYGVPCDLWDWHALASAGGLVDARLPTPDDDDAVSATAAGYLVVGGWVSEVSATAEIQDVYALQDLSAKMRLEARANAINRQVVGATDSPYVVVQVDGGGAVLDSQQIYLAADDEPGGTYSFFIELLAAADGVTAVEVRQDSAVLASRPASEHPPTVELIAPQSGSLDVGTVISWTADDTDDDDLAFDVSYSPDGGASWYAVASGLVTTTWQVASLSGLPGTDQGRLRVLANDGFHTSQDVSDGLISVPYAAPIPMILNPNDGLVIGESEYVLLEGMAADDEDGALTEGFAWASDLQGALGDGTEVVTSLVPGTHRITLTVTDSDKMTAADMVTVTVVQEIWTVYLPVVLR